MELQPEVSVTYGGPTDQPPLGVVPRHLSNYRTNALTPLPILRNPDNTDYFKVYPPVVPEMPKFVVNIFNKSQPPQPIPGSGSAPSESGSGIGPGPGDDDIDDADSDNGGDLTNNTQYLQQTLLPPARPAQQAAQPLAPNVATIGATPAPAQLAYMPPVVPVPLPRPPSRAVEQFKANMAQLGWDVRQRMADLMRAGLSQREAVKRLSQQAAAAAAGASSAVSSAAAVASDEIAFAAGGLAEVGDSVNSSIDSLMADLAALPRPSVTLPRPNLTLPQLPVPNLPPQLLQKTYDGAAEAVRNATLDLKNFFSLPHYQRGVTAPNPFDNGYVPESEYEEPAPRRPWFAPVEPPPLPARHSSDEWDLPEVRPQSPARLEPLSEPVHPVPPPSEPVASTSGTSSGIRQRRVAEAWPRPKPRPSVSQAVPYGALGQWPPPQPRAAPAPRQLNGWDTLMQDAARNMYNPPAVHVSVEAMRQLDEDIARRAAERRAAREEASEDFMNNTTAEERARLLRGAQDRAKGKRPWKEPWE